MPPGDTPDRGRARIAHPLAGKPPPASTEVAFRARTLGRFVRGPSSPRGALRNTEVPEADLPSRVNRSDDRRVDGAPALIEPPKRPLPLRLSQADRDVRRSLRTLGILRSHSAMLRDNAEDSSEEPPTGLRRALPPFRATAVRGSGTPARGIQGRTVARPPAWSAGNARKLSALSADPTVSGWGALTARQHSS